MADFTPANAADQTRIPKAMLRRAAQISCAMRGMDCREQLLLLTLIDYANPNGLTWRPHKLFALELDCSDRTIRRKLKKLKEEGIIVQAKKAEKNRRRSPRYLLNQPLLMREYNHARHVTGQNFPGAGEYLQAVSKDVRPDTGVHLDRTPVSGDLETGLRDVLREASSTAMPPDGKTQSPKRYSKENWFDEIPEDLQDELIEAAEWVANRLDEEFDRLQGNPKRIIAFARKLLADAKAGREARA